MVSTAARTGAHAFLDAMEQAGVELLFTLPGTQTLSLLALMAERKHGPRPIFVRHEQAAAFGAVGYGKLTGRPAVCITVPGPGATNLITGLVSALADGVPLVVATPLVPPELIGRGVVHDSDAEGLFRAAVKAQVAVYDVAELGPALSEAVERALAPRAGPVQVLFPASLFNSTLSTSSATSRTVPVTSTQGDADLGEVAAALGSAKRPVIYVGDRVRLAGASALLVELAEALGAPVITDEGARGSIPEDHPLALGTGSFRCASSIVERGNICLAIGTSFPEWSTGSWRLTLPEPLVHLNDEPSVFGRNYAAALQLTVDLPAGLRRLIDAPAIKGRREDGWGAPAVRAARELGYAQLLADREEYRPDERAGLHPIDVVRALRSSLPRDAIVCVDGSATAAWMNEESFPILADGGFIQPEVFKELGSALMVGIGCRLASPARDVIVVQGDGGFLFQLGELATLVHNEVKLVVVVFEDGYYNGDRIFQEHMFGGRESDCMLFNPDFVQLTRSFGLEAYKPDTVDDMQLALETALADERSSVIAVPIDPMPVPAKLRTRIEEWKRRVSGR